MILGISSYTFGWAIGIPGHTPAHPMDEQTLLDQADALGVKLLQIGDNIPLDTFDKSRLKSLGQRAADLGIQLEIGARKLALRTIDRYTKIAHLLGARLIRFVIDDAGYQPPPKPIIEIIRYAESSLEGLLLGLENHDRFRAAELRHIIDSVNAPNVGVCLDTANSLGAGEDIHTVLEHLAPVTFNLHIKDFTVSRHPHKMGFIVNGALPGQGLLNIPALLAKLRCFGRCETAVLELWTPPEPNLDWTIEKEARWAAEGIQFLKPFFP